MTSTFAKQERAASALIAAAVMTPLAVLLAISEFGPLSWVTVPLSASVGWALAGTPTREASRRQLVFAAIAYGLLVAVCAVAGYVLISMLTTLLEGNSATRPDGPVGYLVFLVITVAALSPFLAIATTAVGLAWAALVRRVVRHSASTGTT